MATYFIKYPGGKDNRQTFSILRRDGKKSTGIKDDRLTVINARLTAGEDFETCRRLTVELKEALRASEKNHPALLNDNLRVVHRYLAGRSRRNLVDPYAQERELVRAAEACGPLAIEHSGEKALQDHLDAAFAGQQHARVVAGVNRLLLFLKKDFKLQGVPVDYAEPAHIGLAAFLTALPRVEPREHHLLLATLFATGARLGEGLAIRAIRPHDVIIKRQLAYNGAKQLVYRLTKTKTEEGRNAVIIPELYDYVKEWAAVGEDKRRELKATKWAEVARRWFGLRAHDLRHSYAKRLAEKDFTLNEIATNLGISEFIARRHYAGWVQSDPKVEALALRLR